MRIAILFLFFSTFWLPALFFSIFVCESTKAPTRNTHCKHCGCRPELAVTRRKCDLAAIGGPTEGMTKKSEQRLYQQRNLKNGSGQEHTKIFAYIDAVCQSHETTAERSSIRLDTSHPLHRQPPLWTHRLSSCFENINTMISDMTSNMLPSFSSPPADRLPVWLGNLSSLLRERH